MVEGAQEGGIVSNLNKAPNRPTVPQVIPLVRAVYKTHCAGCCLHIVTDDDNFEQRHADFCLKWAKESQHPTCILAAEALVQMTNTQRHALYKRYGEYAT